MWLFSCIFVYKHEKGTAISAFQLLLSHKRPGNENVSVEAVMQMVCFHPMLSAVVHCCTVYIMDKVEVMLM